MKFESVKIPIVDLSLSAMPSNTRCPGILLFLHTRIGIESVKEIPEQSPRQQVLRNNTCLQLNKSIIRDRLGKFRFHVKFNKEIIKVL